MVPKISIITVNWNGKAHLESFFSSLRKLDYPRNRIDTIMVDNGSRDESVEFVRSRFPEVKIIEAGVNLGFAEGNNWGIYKAKGDYILLLNNDVVVDKELINKMLEAFSNNPRAAAVGAKVLEWNDDNPAYKKDNTISSSWAKVDAKTAKAFNFTDDRPPGPIDYAAGCAMMVKKEVVAKIGAFDPGYFAYYEDTDWAARMIRAGYEVIYQPEAMIWHRFMSSSKAVASNFNAWMMARNRLRFVIKNFDYASLPYFSVSYAFELFGKTVANAFMRQENDAKLMWRAVAWNLLNFPATIRAKRKESGMLHKNMSYNNNLPLRKVRPSHVVQSKLMNVVVIPPISWYFPLHQRVHHFAKLFALAGASVLYIEPERHEPNGFPMSGLEVWYPNISRNPFQFATDAKHSPSTARHVSALRSILVKSGLLNIYHAVRTFFEDRIYLLSGGQPPIRQYLEKFREYSATDRKIVIYESPYMVKMMPAFKKLGYKIVYDMVDEVSEFKESPSYFSEGEGYLLKNADLVLTTAKPLFERARKYNKNVLLVPNAVEYEHFAAARKIKARPYDMPEPGKPVIGYYGAIWNWFDLELLAYLAHKRPNYDFVLIGTLYEPYRKTIEKMKNVHYLGEKPYSELPKYLASFDVATVLFRKSQLTKSVNPVKVFEYLAGGKPVVSTHLSELEGFPEVTLANSKEEFLNAIDLALHRKPNLKQVDAFLKDKTWDARFLTACGALGLTKKELRAIPSQLSSEPEKGSWRKVYDAPIREPIKLLITQRDSYAAYLFKLHNVEEGNKYKMRVTLKSYEKGLKLEACDGGNPSAPFATTDLDKGNAAVTFDLPHALPSVQITLSSYDEHPRGRIEIEKVEIYSKR